MSSLGLPCPSCKCTLRVPGAAPGRRIKCPRCNTVFTPPAAEQEPPLAEPLAESPPAPAPKPAAAPVAAPVAATDDDVFAKIAAAEDPVATAAGARKPQPAPGEPGNPLPLGDAPKPIKGTPRKSSAAAAREKNPKPAKPAKKRPAAEWDEDETRAKGAISPVWLIGGLTVLAAGVLALGLFVVVRQQDRQAEEAAAAEQRERDAVVRREREEALAKVQLPPELPKVRPGEQPVVPPPFEEPVRPPVEPPVVPPFEPPVRPPVVPPFVPPVEPEKPKLFFPPVAAVALRPAPLAQDRVEIKLPGTVVDACVGGGGRYWCLLLGDQKQVAIFDVNEAKVTKYLPVAAGLTRIAAGMNKLVVANPDAGTLTRYDLATFEKDVTVKAPDGVRGVLLGSASAGPLVVSHRTGASVLDLTTFQPLELPKGRPVYGAGSHFRISPDGHVIGSWATEYSPGGLNVHTLGDTHVKNFSEHTSVGFVIPVADGTTVTAAGVYGPTGKKLTGPEGYFLRLPAQEGKFYLTIPGGGGAQVNTGKGDTDRPTVVYATGEARALVNLPDVALPAGNEAWARGQFLADKKVLFTTTGQLIAVIDKTGDKLVLHKFDLVSALDKAGVDYLLVTSRPPAAEPGKPFKYAPEVKSKKGGVKLKVDAGPDGLKVAADGTLTWDVPANWAGGDNVIVTVSDKSGQEVFHTFTLTPAPAANAGGGPIVAAPPVEPRPDPVPAVDAKPGLVRAAANPAKITPTKAADRAEIKLPGTVDMTCLGGNGRYVLLRIPSEKQVAVLDVCEGKVAKYLPIPEDGALIAAGNEHLFVIAPTANVIQRWNLTTFEKELTVANPLAVAPKQALMGHATDGPLFLAGGERFGAKNGIGLLDGRTLKLLDLPGVDKANANGGGWGRIGWDPGSTRVRISADGRVFGHWCPGSSPSGLRSLVLSSDSVKSYDEHTTVGAIIPGPDGTLFTAAGLFTPELKAIGDKGRYQYWFHAPVPAAHGKMYLSIASEDDFLNPGRKPLPKASLKLVGENKPLVDLSALSGLDVPKDHNQTMAKGLQLHDRVFIVPDAKAMAVLHATADKVTIHALDIETLLDKAGIDYLFVTSKPPGAVCGAAFRYKPEVKSRKGGVKVKLDAGPDGMKVAGDGTVTWAVPENFADTAVSVILTVSDASGQETFHTFTLPVATRPR